MQTRSFYSSPLGKIILTAHNNALTGLYFDGQKYLPDTSALLENNQLPIFLQTAQWLDIYFQGKNPCFTPPLLMIGSDFRQSVWQMLMEVPFGKTITYKEIAEKIGVSDKTVKRAISTLKTNGLIVRIGSDKKGFWSVKDCIKER